MFLATVPRKRPPPSIGELNKTMVSASTIHWFLVLSFFAMPLFAVAIITSKARVERREFLFWTLGWLLLLVALVAGVAWAEIVTAGIFPAFALYGFWFFYLRRLTGRVLDAGYSKAVAFLTFIPLVNLVCMIVLLFVPSKDGPAENELPGVEAAPWQNQ